MNRGYLLLLLLFITFAGKTQNPARKPVILKPVYFDVSPPLRDLQDLPVTKADLTWKDGIVKNRFNIRKNRDLKLSYRQNTDPGIQPYNGSNITDTTVQNFDGLANPNGYLPPDTDGDVGPNHYFQVVNASYAIFNKTGTNVSGTHNTSTIWAGMPNNVNSGDAVVLYDEQADRWLISQFSLPSYPVGPFYQMIAVSMTNDPNGSWYRYQYSFTDMPDYPKFGIWPDGYYMSMNRFTSGAGNWAGAGAVAFNRSQMIAGNATAQSVLFTLPASDEASSLLPADCDGPFPTSGTPNYFTYVNTGPGPLHLGIYEFHVDWANTANSSFGNLLTLAVNTFDNFSGSGIPQQGSTRQLDPIDDRLMYRLQYRKFSSYESMVCNHTVKTGTNTAGIRWYELRNTGSGWSVYQQSTYSPDTRCRWMGSIAMDTAGTIALGYSISGSSMFPSVRYTGRLKTDPLNTMTYAEHGIINGAGAQNDDSGRWGDYSSMSVDPSVPNTFWYTTEYYSSTSTSNWRTRIASFSLITSTVLSINATATPSAICSGETSQLNCNVSGGSGSYTYSWTSSPPGFISGLQNPVVQPVVNTEYTVVVNDGVSTASAHTDVSVQLSPEAFAGPDTIVCAWADMFWLGGASSYYFSVLWTSSGDGIFSTPAQLSTIYYPGMHDKTGPGIDLTLTASPLNPCTTSASAVKHISFDPCTGISGDNQSSLRLSLMPNPAHSQVSLLVSGINNEPISYELIDTDAKIVMKGGSGFSDDRFSVTLDVSSLPKGVYYLRVVSGKNKTGSKLAVE